MKSVIAVALIVSTLSGCAAIQNEDGTTTNTAMYGAGAALAGAVAGALIGKENRAQGALIGAAVHLHLEIEFFAYLIFQLSASSGPWDHACLAKMP